jgi:hypothetical protein
MIFVVVVLLVDVVAVSSRWGGIELMEPFVLSVQRSCSRLLGCWSWYMTSQLTPTSETWKESPLSGTPVSSRLKRHDLASSKGSFEGGVFRF